MIFTLSEVMGTLMYLSGSVLRLEEPPLITITFWTMLSCSIVDVRALFRFFLFVLQIYYSSIYLAGVRSLELTLLSRIWLPLGLCRVCSSQSLPRKQSISGLIYFCCLSLLFVTKFSSWFISCSLSSQFYWSSVSNFGCRVSWTLEIGDLWQLFVNLGFLSICLDKLGASKEFFIALLLILGFCLDRLKRIAKASLIARYYVRYQTLLTFCNNFLMFDRLKQASFCLTDESIFLNANSTRFLFNLLIAFFIELTASVIQNQLQFEGPTSSFPEKLDRADAYFIVCIIQNCRLNMARLSLWQSLQAAASFFLAGVGFDC